MKRPVTNQNSHRAGRRNTEEHNPLYLRPHDQVTLAVLVLVAVIAMGVSSLWFAWSHRGIVDADHIRKLQAEFRVDLNTAPWHEIAMLPEIGEKTARQIIAHRELHGPFDSLESIATVDGIGPHTIAAVAPFLAPLPASNRMVAELPGDTR